MADGQFGGAMVPTGESTSTGTGLNLSQQQATNQAQNQATNTAFNTAYGNSFIPDYSQTPILERIAQEAENYAPQVYNWGIDAYNRNQHSIDDLMRAGQMWASPQHIAAMMGQAEAGVQQAGEQARQSAIQDLQSYGIDPSAGRYAALDNAMRVQTAASAAGAGNQQRNADIDRGITMQNQAMSAGLQNTQIGYGAANALNSLYGTGMQLKYSPLGQTTTSQGMSSGQSSGSSTGQSTGESFGMNQQASQSLQQQPVNVMKNVGPMVARGGYIGHDHIEHPDDVKGYDFGGPVAGRLSGPVSSAPMSFPARPFLNPSTPMPSAAAMRPPDFFSSPQAAYGSMRNLDTSVQAGIRSLPLGVQGRAESMYERTRGVMPRMLGFQEGGEVNLVGDAGSGNNYAGGGGDGGGVYAAADTGGDNYTGATREDIDEVQRRLREEEQRGEETPAYRGADDPLFGKPFPSREEDPNLGRGAFAGQGLRDPSGDVMRDPSQLPPIPPRATTAQIPGPPSSTYPTPAPPIQNPAGSQDPVQPYTLPPDYTPPPAAQPQPGDKDQPKPLTKKEWQEKYGTPQTGQQTAPPDQITRPVPDQQPTPDQTAKPSPDREQLPTQTPPTRGKPADIPDFKPGDKTPGGGTVQPDGSVRYPDGTVVPPATHRPYRGPSTGDPNYVPPDDPNRPPVIVQPRPSGPVRPDPTTRQWPSANIPPGHPLYQGPGQRPAQQTGGGGGAMPSPNPDAAPGGRYRAYNPISLVAGPPAGSNYRDPMTGEWLTLQPGELGQEDASITGKFGRRLAAQTALGAAQMLEMQRAGVFEPEEIRRELRRQRRGYAGGGVVGTTAAGFTPSGPVGGAPISTGAPSFTSGMTRGMARGGPVDPTTGGFVSQAFSPSGGGQVDDVPARLNEGEYVIPRDVVQFKGKEFFHKLIMQARKNREAHQQSFFDGGGVQNDGQAA